MFSLFLLSTMHEEAQVGGGGTGRHHHHHQGDGEGIQRQAPCLSPLMMSELPSVAGSTIRFLSPKAGSRPSASSPRPAMVEVFSQDVESPGATLHRKVRFVWYGVGGMQLRTDVRSCIPSYHETCMKITSAATRPPM